MTNLLISEEKFMDQIKKVATQIGKESRESARGHLYAADFWSNIHMGLGVISTVLASVVGASIFSEDERLDSISGIIALILVVISALSTFTNAEKRSVTHYKAGNEYLTLQQKAYYLNDVESMLGKKSVDDFAEEIKTLTKERDELRKNTPQLSYMFRKR